MKKPNKKNTSICVVGLGYVGLPIAIEFGKYFNVIGFDVDKSRIEELNRSYDRTLEINSREFKKSKNIKFTYNSKNIINCNVYIITVPTPVNNKKKPDIKLLKQATNLISKALRKGDIVIYESTVFPGCTEEVCVPLLERGSKLKYNSDFHCGYSPERIVPGDTKYKLVDIKKIVSGSNKDAALFVNSLYKKIIVAGTFQTKSIKIAEAAKVIENTQRDLNIALVNELAIIFDKMNIKSSDVFDAVSTKWNALPFRPGLVGGHCIGVDPYYLTYKSRKLNYEPKIILAGRKLNDSMASYVFKKIIEQMKLRKIKSHGSKVLVLGITFKENCNDHRNTKVIDLINLLKKRGCIIDIVDPWVSKNEIKKEYKLIVQKKPRRTRYDVIIIAVSHEIFKRNISSYESLKKNNGFIFDIKSVIPHHDANLSL